jgi:hypothetical protein
MGLSQAPSLEAWEADARAGEAVLEKHMAGKDWHVLRYPFLDAGGSGARHHGARDARCGGGSGSRSGGCGGRCGRGEADGEEGGDEAYLHGVPFEV